jgi:hypothetical protein
VSVMITESNCQNSANRPAGTNIHPSKCFEP